MFLQSRLCSLLPKPLGSRQTFSLSVRRTAGRPSTSVKGERFILVETSECGFYLEAHIVGASLGFSLFIHFYWYYIIIGDNCTFFAVMIQIVFSYTSLTLFVSDGFLEISFCFLSFIICSLFFLFSTWANQPVGRMTGGRLLFSLTLMSVLSLLTLQMSRGEILADESCTIQLLVPGLKGTLSFALWRLSLIH